MRAATRISVAGKAIGRLLLRTIEGRGDVRSTWTTGAGCRLSYVGRGVMRITAFRLQWFQRRSAALRADRTEMAGTFG